MYGKVQNRMTFEWARRWVEGDPQAKKKESGYFMHPEGLCSPCVQTERLCKGSRQCRTVWENPGFLSSASS